MIFSFYFFLSFFERAARAFEKPRGNFFKRGRSIGRKILRGRSIAFSLSSSFRVVDDCGGSSMNNDSPVRRLTFLSFFSAAFRCVVLR